MVRCCIGVMVGLPAVGKSAWARKLSQCEAMLLGAIQRREPQVERVVVQVIEFDKEIGVLDLGNNESSSMWKKQRKTVHVKVDRLVQQFLRDSTPQSFLFVILDDNMYYKSMRRIYYSLSQRLKCGYMQIVVHTDYIDLQQLLEHDMNRETSVGEITIVRMYDRMEYPDINTKWEKFSCYLPPWACHTHDIPESFLDCMNGSIIAAEEMENAFSGQFQEEVQTIRHSFELSLREIVNSSIKSLQHANTSTSILRTAGKQFSEYKKEFLSSLPPVIAPEDVDSLLKEFIHHIQRITNTESGTTSI
mmetsp:Transcript_12295/g.15290  ORF Transcript_12295/g.15290 Transcript_12295/m.15290 type:complete len:304 (-) Transcript_12295:70-981(-)